MNKLLKLRIKDINLGFENIYIWNSKSQKDRILPLPLSLKDDLKIQMNPPKKSKQFARIG